jgi:hypothetical protein
MQQPTPRAASQLVREEFISIFPAFLGGAAVLPQDIMVNRIDDSFCNRIFLDGP